MESIEQRPNTNWLNVILIGLSCVFLQVAVTSIESVVYKILTDHGISIDTCNLFSGATKFAFPLAIMIVAIIFFRQKRKSLIIVGLLLFAIGLFSCAFAFNGSVFLISCLLIHIARGIVYAGAVPLLFDSVSSHQFHVGFVIFHLCVAVGGAVTMISGGIVFNKSGASALFWVHGIVLLLALIPAYFIKEVSHSTPDLIQEPEPLKTAGNSPEFADVFFNPTVILLIVAFGLVNIFCIGTSSLSTNIYYVLHGIKHIDMVMSLAYIFWLVLIAGAFLAFYMDHLRKTNIEKPLYISMFSILCFIPMTFLFIYAWNDISLYAGHVGIMLFSSFTYLPMTVLMLTVVESRVRAFVYGLNILATVIVSRPVATMIAGWASESNYLQTGMLILTLALPLAFLALWVAMKKAPKDYEYLKNRLARMAEKENTFSSESME